MATADFPSPNFHTCSLHLPPSNNINTLILNTSMNHPFGFPLFLVCDSSILRILFPTHHSSLLCTDPSHPSRTSLVCLYTVLPALFLYLSLQTQVAASSTLPPPALPPVVSSVAAPPSLTTSLDTLLFCLLFAQTYLRHITIDTLYHPLYHAFTHFFTSLSFSALL